MAVSMPSGEVPTISVTRYVRSAMYLSSHASMSSGGVRHPPRRPPWVRSDHAAGEDDGRMRVDVQGLEREARGLLHPEVYDFIAGGSGQERTLRANAKAWRQVRLLPRVLRDVASVDTGIDVLGSPLATPIAVAPTAAHRMVHQDGEVATASGAARAGALYVLSTRSSRRIEDCAAVTAAAGGTWWFQAYVMRDRELTARLVRRAAAAGAAAIVLTGDTPVVGRKRRDRGDSVVTEDDFRANIGVDADL